MKLINNSLEYTKNFPRAIELEQLLNTYRDDFIIEFLKNTNFNFEYRILFSFNFLENDSDIGKTGCIFSSYTIANDMFNDHYMCFKVYASEQEIINEFMRYIRLELYV